MNTKRLYLHGNPWPEGHPIRDFEWTAKIREESVWFHLHLRTEKYYAERDIPESEFSDDAPSWQHPAAWQNFHQCTISSNNWHEGGFPACTKAEYESLGFLGVEFYIDPLPVDLDETEDLAFLTYTLGHDSVADHKIKFTLDPVSKLFCLDWSGKITLTYSGDSEFKYDFSVKIPGLSLPNLNQN